MGCGGSRSDAIEPRRHESWTRETESTWLTSTDAEGPNNSTGSFRTAPLKMIAFSVKLEQQMRKESKGVEARSSFSTKDKRMVNTGIQCGKAPLTSGTCTSQQRRS
ncbi:brain and acute leukemia cytoplasmic protein, partial [Silurus meridionalis]